MTYHKIRSLELTGGFLQGVRLDFDDSLNCIIGGRGTGKTTVLEALRYVLDQMPDPNTEKDRHRSIERLLQSNLGAGSARAEIETVDGTSYTVVRGFGESPLVTNEQGDPVDINIGKNIVFGVDVYSQNEIEDIANDPLFQLRLIDKFIHTQVAELEREIRDTTRSLDTNATTILETRRMVDDLAEATRELPDVAEKIRGFEKADGGGGDLLRTEHEQKSLRARELRLVEGVRSLYGDGIDGIKAVAESLRRRFDDVFDLQLDGTPNRALVEKIRDSVLTAVETAERQLESAKDALGAAQGDLKPLEAGLAERQAVQEKQYRELIDKHEQERAKGVERTRLEQRHTDLKAKEKKLNEKKVALRNLNDQRAQLRARLSDLRDDRYHLRLDVAQRLNEHLSPMIRVRVEQFGNMEDYRDLLTQSMKGSGLRYASIVNRAVERLPPAELVALVQGEDRATLERELDLDADRATRLIIQLKDKPDIFAIEVVELHDRPILELKDGPDYKDAASLSTGQKCTTILPILLMESERPLLIDQPEDNLDNAFVFETIVQSLAEVRGRRQLIFVTHNPNIPVLGDASRVFCLHSTGRASTVANVGSVDDVAQEIMTILEGGRAAFEARRERYGQPIPEAERQ